jgi:predicted GNAT superfamily acetyltransferase
MRLRPIEPRDHAFVLELNRVHEHLTAPLDRARLLDLLSWSDHADVIDVDGAPAGFVLTFAPRTPYDSASYVELGRLFDEFTYLDRIVIGEAFWRRGLGTFVYDELEAGATTRMVLEVNIDPPNEPSLAFHEARGYTGVAEFGPADHRVLQMSKELGRP